jgi:hypothetical protein
MPNPTPSPASAAGPVYYFHSKDVDGNGRPYDTIEKDGYLKVARGNPETDKDFEVVINDLDVSDEQEWEFANFLLEALNNYAAQSARLGEAVKLIDTAYQVIAYGHDMDNPYECRKDCKACQMGRKFMRGRDAFLSTAKEQGDE